MAVLRASVGLPPDPGGDMLFRYLHLISAPPSMQAPGVERPPTAHFVQRVVFDLSGDERLPAWVAALPARPTIFATLGTVFNKDASVFAAILAALQDEPINLILAVGRDVDPAQFGPCPENVHIERYIPLSLLMPHCDLVLCHAGFGTVMAALEHGIPLVNIPISADNPEIAARCAELGFSVTVPADERTPEAIRSAVRTVLASAAYRTHAERLRDEMAALPSLEHAVVLLERLASEKTPFIDHQ